MIVNKKIYTKKQLINEIVWLFKEWKTESTDKILLRLQRYNKMLLRDYNCEFLDAPTYYYDHNINNYVGV